MRRFHFKAPLSTQRNLSAFWTSMRVQQMIQTLKTLPRLFISTIQKPHIQYRIAFLLMTILTFLLCVLSLSVVQTPGLLA